MLQGTPILVLREGTERTRDKSASGSNIAAARAIADAVRTTLGPRGMDKMLVDSMGDITITNDGVTILKEIDVEHPAGKMLVEVAKTQDQQCGDGTTTAVVLAGELLKRAEYLLEQNIHPTVITRGYQIAVQEAKRLLEAGIGTPVKPDDEQSSSTARRPRWAPRASSAPGTRSPRSRSRRSARSSTSAATGVVADVDQIKVEKRHGGTISDTQLVDGIILDKERGRPRMPRRGQGCEDRAPELRPRDQEDRDREQDQHQERGPDPELPRRGRPDVPPDGRPGQGLGRERDHLPEGDRRRRPALPREGGHPRAEAGEGVGPPEARARDRWQDRHRTQGAQRGRPWGGAARRREEDRRGPHDVRHRLQEPAFGIDPHPRRHRARHPGGRALAPRRAEGRLERHRGRGGLPRRRRDRRSTSRSSCGSSPPRSAGASSLPSRPLPRRWSASPGPSPRTAVSTRSTRSSSCGAPTTAPTRT